MSYKILFIPRIGDTAIFEKEFVSRAEAKAALELIDNYTLLLRDSGLMSDYSSAGTLMERNQGGRWVTAGSGESCYQCQEVSAERDALRSKLTGARDALREAAKQFLDTEDFGRAVKYDGHADALAKFLAD